MASPHSPHSHYLHPPPHSYPLYPPHPHYLHPQFYPYPFSHPYWLPPASPSHPPLQILPDPQPQKLIPIWAIWSRRPSDPLRAPAIIISPHAHPPNDIILHALQLQTPPPTPPPLLLPPLPPSSLLDDDDPQKHETILEPIPEADPPPTPTPTPTPIPAPQPQPQLEIEPRREIKTSIPNPPACSSSSATSVAENLTDTDACVSTVPGSRLSSSTSVVSLSLVQPGKAEAEATRSANGTTTTAPESTATLAPLAPTPAPAPPKKLWSSLFQSPGPPSSSGGRSGLPTSNVVGISIPGSSSSYGSTSTGKKSQLAALLSSSSSSSLSPTVGTTTTTIRPRGLINSGNMCFANAVLQMLVYTLPFQRFFVELGRIRGRGRMLDNEKKEKEDNEKEKEEEEEEEKASRTPLVDAMVEFVKEFVVLEDDVASSGAHAHATMNGHGNGSGSASASAPKVSGGKGKERETNDSLFYGGGQQEEGGGGGGGSEESFVPTSVYEAMKEKKRFDTMRGGQQEDAEEFLGFLLESLEEELVVLKEEVVGRSLLSDLSVVPPAPVASAVTAPQQEEERGWQEVGKRNRTVVTRTMKSTETAISKIFGGKFRTTLKVPYVKKDSVIVEDWRSVRVDIQSDHIQTVQDALSYISHPQPVQVTHPARPGTTLEGHQQVHMEALPPILVIHMKRFCYDTAVGGVVKVGKQVQFGPELDVGSEMMSPALRKPGSGSGTKYRYRLYGVLYHHGMSASGGHYTLDVLHPRKWAGTGAMGKGKGGWEGWMRIDDELVSDVRSEDVFGPAEWEGWEQAGSGRTAYLLFYKRVR